MILKHSSFFAYVCPWKMIPLECPRAMQPCTSCPPSLCHHFSPRFNRHLDCQTCQTGSLHEDLLRCNAWRVTHGFEKWLALQRWSWIRCWRCHMMLDGGFKCFSFLSLPGEMIQFDLRIFFKWVGSTTIQDGSFSKGSCYNRNLAFPSGPSSSWFFACWGVGKARFCEEYVKHVFAWAWDRLLFALWMIHAYMLHIGIRLSDRVTFIDA